ncbi:MAG: hypothetical protein UW76_C0015G0023, partial [Parcubacteria group bacterium GW2011_GWF2_44_8b]
MDPYVCAQAGEIIRTITRMRKDLVKED